MPDETKVFIEQLSEKLQGIATQLDAALKAVQAGRAKLNNILSNRFDKNEFAFVQEIGKQIKKGLDDKTLQVGTTIPICNQILEKVNLIKKIKIGGVKVTNDILTSEDRLADVEKHLNDVLGAAKEMAIDKAGKSGKKKAVLNAIDGLITALKDEMKKGLGVSQAVAAEMNLGEDASPEEIEKAKKDYINNKLKNAGLTAAFGFTDESEEVKAAVAEVGDDLSKLADKLPDLKKGAADKMVSEMSNDGEIAGALCFLGLTDAAELFAGDDLGGYDDVLGDSPDGTREKIKADRVVPKLTAAVNDGINAAKEDEDSAKDVDLDVYLEYLGYAEKNLGTMMKKSYGDEIENLISDAHTYAETGEAGGINLVELKNELKSLKTNVLSAANGARAANIDVINKINEIKKVDQKAANKILTSYNAISDADSADSLNQKVDECIGIINKIANRVDTGDGGPVGDYEELFN